MSLFPALDREWVLWTPRGYYETSAIGDRRYLGWHRNRVAADQPTDYFSFDHFERELRQPGALIRFLETADLGALTPDPAGSRPADPRAGAGRGRGPASQRSRSSSPRGRRSTPLVMQGVALPVRVRASSEDRVAGRGLIRTLRVLVDGGRAAEIAINPPAAEVDRRIPLNLNPGRHRVSVTAVNDRDKSRTESFDVIAPEPPRPPDDEIDARPPQLVVLAIGADRFAAREPALPPIPFAVEDSRDVGSFLGAPQGTPRFQRVDVRSILGPDATAERILEALDRARRPPEEGGTRPGRLRLRRDRIASRELRPRGDDRRRRRAPSPPPGSPTRWASWRTTAARSCSSSTPGTRAARPRPRQARAHGMGPRPLPQERHHVRGVESRPEQACRHSRTRCVRRGDPVLAERPGGRPAHSRRPAKP